METKEIQKLIDYISKSDLGEVKIETDKLKLHIKRNGGTYVAPAGLIAPAAAVPVSQVMEAPKAVPEIAAVSVPSPAENSNHVEIKSPMIGTFYRSSGPDKPNFKEVGDSVAIGDVICIVEAMKLFNEIEAETSGKIVKVLVDDASPIEFDQPLFLIDPS